jgi:hypothetical protein
LNFHGLRDIKRLFRVELLFDAWANRGAKRIKQPHVPIFTQALVATTQTVQERFVTLSTLFEYSFGHIKQKPLSSLHLPVDDKLEPRSISISAKNS